MKKFKPYCEDCVYWRLSNDRKIYGECTNENSRIYKNSGGCMVHRSSYCDQWTAKQKDPLDGGGDE